MNPFVLLQALKRAGLLQFILALIEILTEEKSSADRDKRSGGSL